MLTRRALLAAVPALALAPCGPTNPPPPPKVGDWIDGTDAAWLALAPGTLVSLERANERCGRYRHWALVHQQRSTPGWIGTYRVVHSGVVHGGLYTPGAQVYRSPDEVGAVIRALGVLDDPAAVVAAIAAWPDLAPKRVHVGRITMGPDPHESDPDPIFERWARSMVPQLRDLART